MCHIIVSCLKLTGLGRNLKKYVDRLIQVKKTMVDPDNSLKREQAFQFFQQDLSFEEMFFIITNNYPMGFHYFEVDL